MKSLVRLLLVSMAILWTGVKHNFFTAAFEGLHTIRINKMSSKKAFRRSSVGLSQNFRHESMTCDNEDSEKGFHVKENKRLKTRLMTSREARILTPITSIISCTCMNSALAFEIENEILGNSSLDGKSLSETTSLTIIDPEATENSFQTTLEQFFPTAIKSTDAAQVVDDALYSRGFNFYNTLFGASICIDEINRGRKTIFSELERRFGDKAVLLGRQGGFPGGKSGIEACFDHIPEHGKVVILYAPHVGISKDGVIGEILRQGQSTTTLTCNDVIEAYELANKSPKLKKHSKDKELFDYQSFVVEEMIQRRKNKDASVNDVVAATYQMYEIIKDRLLSQIADLALPFTSVAVVGGIIINQYQGDEYFQPLSFQICKRDPCKQALNVVDLFQEAFVKPEAEAKLLQ